MNKWGGVALVVLGVASVVGLGIGAGTWLATDAPVTADTLPPAHVVRLTCGQTTLVVKTYCTGQGIEQQCRSQESTATTIGKEATPAHDILRPHGTAAVSVQCFESKKTKKKEAEMFFALTYASGGNCELCEWVDLVDMRLRSAVKDAQHHKKAVNKLHRRLTAVGQDVSLTPDAPAVGAPTAASTAPAAAASPVVAAPAVRAAPVAVAAPVTRIVPAVVPAPVLRAPPVAPAPTARVAPVVAAPVVRVAPVAVAAPVTRVAPAVVPVPVPRVPPVAAAPAARVAPVVAAPAVRVAPVAVAAPVKRVTPAVVPVPVPRVPPVAAAPVVAAPVVRVAPVAVPAQAARVAPVVGDAPVVRIAPAVPPSSLQPSFATSATVLLKPEVSAPPAPLAPSTPAPALRLQR